MHRVWCGGGEPRLPCLPRAGGAGGARAGQRGGRPARQPTAALPPLRRAPQATRCRCSLLCGFSTKLGAGVVRGGAGWPGVGASLPPPGQLRPLPGGRHQQRGLPCSNVCTRGRRQVYARTLSSEVIFGTTACMVIAGGSRWPSSTWSVRPPPIGSAVKAKDSSLKVPAAPAYPPPWSPDCPDCQQQ